MKKWLVEVSVISLPRTHHYCYHSRDRQSNTVWKGEHGQSLLKSVWQHDYHILILDKNSAAAAVCGSATADYSQTRELTLVKQLLNTHLPACFPSGKTACVKGKIAHMANLAEREECSNVGWVVAVTELCEKLSLLPGNFEFLLSTSYCRKTYCLHQRTDSYEIKVILKHAVSWKWTVRVKRYV